MSDDKKKKKNYVVRLWYTWYDDIEVEAEDAEEAETKVLEMPWSQIEKDFDLSQLEYDTTEIFGGDEE